MTEILDPNALWERGVSLENAWWEFEPFIDLRHINLLLRDPANDPDNDLFVEQKINWAGDTAERRELKYQMLKHNCRGALFDKIYHGELWAIGFRNFPTNCDTPERVPRHLFFLDAYAGEHTPENVNWAKGEVGDSEHRFFDIRVIQSPDRVVSHIPRKAQIGRPRKRDYLESACKIARKSHPNFCEMSVEQAKKVVEPILKTDLNSPAGFEDGINSETFRRAKKAVCGNTPHSK